MKKEWLAAQYEKMSATDIAKKLGVTKQAVHYWMKKLGLKVDGKYKARPQKMKENASYNAIHHWLTRQMGQPKTCEKCGTKSAKKYEWANTSGNYERNVWDYWRLCSSCHRKYDDIGKRGWETRRANAI